MGLNWNQLAPLTGALFVSAFLTKPVGELTLLDAIHSALPPPHAVTSTQSSKPTLEPDQT